MRSDVGSITQTDLGYTGQRALDVGMGGLMDYHARFYDPYLNHFTQPDSIIPGVANSQSWNRYSYVTNSPVNFSDPTGHCSGPGNVWIPDSTSYCTPLPAPTTSGSGNGGSSGGSSGGNSGGGNNNDDIIHPGGGGLIGPPAPTIPTIDQLQLGLPRTKILHPLNGNTVSEIPIYDYSHYYPRIIGYRITSYAYDDAHFSIPNLVIPSDPITFSSIFADIAKGLLKPMAPGIELLIPGAGEALTVVAGLDSLNSAITFDTHLRTHDVYFTTPSSFTFPLENPFQLP